MIFDLLCFPHLEFVCSPESLCWVSLAIVSQWMVCYLPEACAHSSGFWCSCPVVHPKLLLSQLVLCPVGLGSFSVDPENVFAPTFEWSRGVPRSRWQMRKADRPRSLVLEGDSKGSNAAWLRRGSSASPPSLQSCLFPTLWNRVRLFCYFSLRK